MAERTLRIVGRDRSRAVRRLPLITLALDALLATLVGVLALWGGTKFDIFASSAGVHDQVGVAGPLIIVGWLVVVALRGGYRRDILGSGTDEYRMVFHSILLVAGGMGVASYLARFSLSRGFFMLAFLIGVPVMLIGRWTLRQMLHRLRQHGHLPVNILVSGTPTYVDEVTRVLRRESWLGYHVIGAVVPDGQFVGETATGVPVLGSAAAVTSVAVRHQADLIFFAGGSAESGEEMRSKIWELEEHDIGVVVAPKLIDVSRDRATFRPIGGLPLIHVDRPRWNDAARINKRTFDVVGSTLLILALLPLLAIATAAIWFNDRGPIRYRQARIGRNGDEFGCWKFRTMVVNADALIPQMLEQADQSALLFKMKDDPRITRPGKWLRRFSIDELPQLFNVLAGDMSLVGPRPQVRREVDLYEGGMSRRLLVRPGMTGLWQVSGRSDLSAEEAMRLDLYYVDNWSMLQDLNILSRTVGAVFGSRGAY